MTVLLFVIFTVALLAAAAAAETGRQGQVCVRGVGYTVPAAVEADPVLNARANTLVARWCTAAVVLAALPLVVLVLYGFEGEDLPLWVLGCLAAHGFVLACVVAYPFHRITRLADADRREPS